MCTQTHTHTHFIHCYWNLFPFISIFSFMKKKQLNNKNGIYATKTYFQMAGSFSKRPVHLHEDKMDIGLPALLTKCLSVTAQNLSK